MAIEVHDFKRLMNQARVKLPGASDEGLKAELFDVLFEFFNDSSCWVEQIPFSTIGGVNSYDLVPQQGGRITRLVSVVDQFGTPQGALMPEFGTIILSFTPNTVDSFFANFTEVPTLPTTKDHVPIVPDWTLPIYGIYVLDGLLGKMMSQPKKSYSDSAQATYHLKRFRNGIAMARQQRLKANTPGARAWVFPQSSGSQRGGVSVGNSLRF